MTIIHMETEKVRSLANTLRATARRIDSQQDALNAQIRRLQDAWEGGNAFDFYQDAHQFTQKLDQHIRLLDTLAERVLAEVTEWETVDGQFGRKADTNHSRVTRSQASSWFFPSLPNKDWLEAGMVAFGGILTSSHVVTKQTANKIDELVFSGKNGYRKWAGLPEYLRHVKPENFAKTFSKNKNTGLNVVFAGIELTEKSNKSFAQYQTWSERTAALAYDAVFVATKMVAVHAVQSAVMSIIGSVALGVLATAGAPAAVIVGAGVALWWASGFAASNLADAAYDYMESSGIKDRIVRNLSNAAITINRQTVKFADAAFRHTIKSIVSWLN